MSEKMLQGVRKVVVGFIILIAFCAIAWNSSMNTMDYASNEMSRLTSQSGNSLAEAYYQDMGSYLGGAYGTIKAILIASGLIVGLSYASSGGIMLFYELQKQKHGNTSHSNMYGNANISSNLEHAGVNSEKKVEATLGYCENCGQLINPEGKFCTGCGCAYNFSGEDEK